MGERIAARPGGAALRLWLLLGIFVGAVLLFGRTASGIVSIWHRSNTFGHGYVIVPIAMWLVWRRRASLAQVPVRPAPLWIAALAVLGAGWLLGRVANVLILEQYAFALMIPVAIAALLGPAMVRALTFPLAFLMLGVPAGDFIVPSLINFTANFTVKTLQITGVPVARAGDFITLPRCQWAITDACSGFRYLMASLTLGCLYANLRFRTWRNRLFFVGLSLVLPILANGVRAYIVVMLGYLSEMKVAVGVDHFIYGWLLFAVYSTILFWIGSRIQEPEVAGAAGPAAPPAAPAGPMRRVAVTAAAAAVMMGAWPAYAAHLRALRPPPTPVSLTLPDAVGSWSETLDPIALWKPDYHGAETVVARTYRKGDRVVLLYVAYYRRQRQGSELINSQNEIVKWRNREWRGTGDEGRTVRLNGRPVHVWETRISGEGEKLIVWHRFWLHGSYSANPYMAQLIELRNRILTGKDDAALVAVVTPYGDRTAPAEEGLRNFLAAVTPPLDSALRRASGSP